MSMVREHSEPREHREGKALLDPEMQGAFTEEVAFEMSLERKAGYR